MKIILFVLLLLASPFVLAQGTGSSIADAITNYGPGLIMVLMPVVIAGLKKIAAAIPGWTLPLIAMVVPAFGDLALTYLAGLSVASSPLVAAAAGLAGVGLREMLKHWKSIVGMK